MSRLGNRPDCAYFLLLGLSLAVFLGAIGGVLTYIAFWPDSALAKDHGSHHHGSHGQSFTAERVLKHPTNATIQHEENVERRVHAFEIVGPICIALCAVISIFVGVLALKFDCDHEPEPNIAFLRLKSELSLNFESEKNKYELLMTPMPSSSSSSSGQESATMHRY